MYDLHLLQKVSMPNIIHPGVETTRLNEKKQKHRTKRLQKSDNKTKLTEISYFQMC